MPTHIEHCAYCRALIGRSETPWVHKEDVVCAGCWVKLQIMSLGNVGTRALIVEQTSKSWSVHNLLALLLIIVGTLVLALGARVWQKSISAVPVLGCSIVLLGLCWLLMARIRVGRYHR
jgi:hypothetical protein